jgi:acetyl-CoA acetyltransferase
MRKVYVIGVGMTQFGKFPEKSFEELGRVAAWEAIKDAGINPKDIEVAYCGNMMGGSLFGRDFGVGQLVLREVGITGIPIARVENACASGPTAIREAWIAVGSGLYDIAIAIGVEKLTGARKGVTAMVGDSIEGVSGLTPAAMWAMRARKHMEKYGTTLEQLAKVRVKNQKNGSKNPRAQYQKIYSVEDVLNAPMLSDPLTILHACPVTDGAAAAIICSKRVAKKYSSHPIQIAACSLKSGTYPTLRDISVNDLETRAAKEAYEMAGVGPEDISFAEVHDCFTIAEICRCENLMLCKEGEGGRMIEEGISEIGGALPINPRGGLLAMGHPIGATGIAQVAESVWQLRGQAGARQVQGAKVALTHCSGGFVDDDNGAGSVIILKK